VLEAGVPGGLNGVRAQEISQVNVIAMRLAARHYRVQVVADGTGGRQERFPASAASTRSRNCLNKAGHPGS
jgi:hypothetical protein